MVSPFLVQLHEALELGLKVIYRIADIFFGRLIELEVRRGFGRICLRCLLALALFFVLNVRLRLRIFFQHRVLLQLLLNKRLELECWRLQQRE